MAHRCPGTRGPAGVGEGRGALALGRPSCLCLAAASVVSEVEKRPSAHGRNSGWETGLVGAAVLEFHELQAVGKVHLRLEPKLVVGSPGPRGGRGRWVGSAGPGV